MNGVIVLVITVIGTAIVFALLFRYFRSRSVRSVLEQEPIIELERLVNCTSCGSLVPEGVSRCAFCGAAQKRSA